MNKQQLTGWQAELRDALINLKGWYVKEHPPINDHAVQSFFKEIFNLYVKHAPDPQYPQRNFFYVLHNAKAIPEWSMDWYFPGEREGKFTVYKNYCAIRPTDQVIGNELQYERIGRCPFQLHGDEHNTLLHKLTTPGMSKKYICVVFSIPRSMPYERAFRNGAIPEGYYERLPFVGTVTLW